MSASVSFCNMFKRQFTHENDRPAVANRVVGKRVDVRGDGLGCVLLDSALPKGDTARTGLGIVIHGSDGLLKFKLKFKNRGFDVATSASEDDRR